ncbi:MAG TPA: KpsF/GutQ family sugar-phosphate isomerase [Novosphingobium sp.]|nr:KpsF/GutQ family sugar-phosphate isomerase [Novosphingobium sp.]
MPAARAPDGAALLARGRAVIAAEGQGLALLAAGLDGRFADAVALIAAGRRLVLAGMGKSGHIARKLAATFAATGTPALFVHPAEAAHGDLGMIAAGDVLLLLSNSGETRELRPLLAHGRALGCKVIGMAGRAGSFLMAAADVGLCLPQVAEACAISCAPTVSSTMQMALGDALALAVMDLCGVAPARLRALHPGGALGLQLARVDEVMQGPGALPLVEEATPMAEVISVITRGRFGLAGVTDGAGRLVGAISDGDLRRHIGQLAGAVAGAVMSRAPVWVPAGMLAREALALMGQARISAVFVMAEGAGGAGRPLGMLHVHDLLRLGAA